MARRKRRRRRGFNTSSIYKYIRIAALLSPAAYHAMRSGVSNKDKFADIIESYTGYNLGNNTFILDKAVKGWSPFIVASLMTYGIPKLTSILRRF